MNDNRIMTIGILAGAAILVPVLIGLGTGLPAPVYLTLALLLLVSVGVVTVRWLTAHPSRPWGGAEPLPPRPAPLASPPEQTLVESVDLPSAAADCRFRFSATVSWQPAGDTSHGDPAALAREAVVTRAAAITERFALTDHGLAEHRLAAALGMPKPDAQGRVRTWATSISLAVDEQDADRLRTLANLRKNVELWEHERSHEINVRRYLGEDVLRSTGSTLVWWLARDFARIDDAVSRLGAFARISSVAQGRDDPDPDVLPVLRVLPGHVTDAAANGNGPDDGPHAARSLIDRLLPNADDDERGMLADHLARSVDEYGFDGFGDRLRASYELQQIDDPTRRDDVQLDSSQGDDRERDGAGPKDDHGRETQSTDGGRAEPVAG